MKGDAASCRKAVEVYLPDYQLVLNPENYTIQRCKLLFMTDKQTGQKQLIDHQMIDIEEK